MDINSELIQEANSKYILDGKLIEEGQLLRQMRFRNLQILTDPSSGKPVVNDNGVMQFCFYDECGG
tara:strand:- start:7479 stop:7676 length:198 start_codon:yes stop_codon:yes gene_type:complete